MKNKITDSNSRWSRTFKLFLQKILYQKFDLGKPIILIMGCQRSGTTLISGIFDKFLDVRVFGEFSPLSSDCEFKIRLNKLANVKSQLCKVNANAVVLKPLVESHRAVELLNELENGHIIWAYRHYVDVAMSDIKQFTKTGGHGNLLPIIEGQTQNWRAQGLPQTTIDKVKSLYSKDLSPIECACLFWYVRNSLYFSQNLHENPNVYLWKYEELIVDPEKKFTMLEKALNLNFKNINYSKHFSSDSIGKKFTESVNPEILDLCEETWIALNEHNNK